MNRYLPIVLTKMIDEVPEEFTRLRMELDSIRSSALYSSPETMLTWWKRTLDVLIDHVPNPKADWELRVRDLFNGNPSPKEITITKEPDELPI